MSSSSSGGKSHLHAIVPDGRSSTGRKIIFDNMLFHTNRVEHSKSVVDCHLTPVQIGYASRRRPTSASATRRPMSAYVSTKRFASFLVANVIFAIRPQSAGSRRLNKREQYLQFFILFV
jgi:hypothetical protein